MPNYKINDFDLSVGKIALKLGSDLEKGLTEDQCLLIRE